MKFFPDTSMVEDRTVNATVVGSSPTLGATYKINNNK